MKRLVTLMAVALVALFIMGGCATPEIPAGSVLRAEYQGFFHSDFSSGNITVTVYDAPDGSRPVSGELNPVTGDARGTFYGQMKGSHMEAKLETKVGELSGTVTGEMSPDPDAQTMAGTFKLDIWTGSLGTWEAKKKWK
jgi:outer membrane lipoprotein SlyB